MVNAALEQPVEFPKVTLPDGMIIEAVSEAAQAAMDPMFVLDALAASWKETDND